MNSRITRILTGILIPSPTAAILYVIYALLINHNVDTSDISNLLLMCIFFGYLTIGMQSIIYSLIMEFIIAKYIINNLIAVIISCFMGSLIGLFLRSDFLLFMGISIGLTTGLILRLLLHKYPVKN